MTNLLTRIREKVIASVPEIVELKPACEVMVHGMKHTIYGCDEGMYSAYLNLPLPKGLEVNGFYDCEFLGTDPTIEILGRPIHLADVLLAIEQNQPQQVSMNAATTLGTNWGGKEKWNLRADDLEKQSPECWKFLGEILGV